MVHPPYFILVLSLSLYLSTCPYRISVYFEIRDLSRKSALELRGSATCSLTTMTYGTYAALGLPTTAATVLGLYLILSGNCYSSRELRERTLNNGSRLSQPPLGRLQAKASDSMSVHS
jgi:hypothetical protein